MKRIVCLLLGLILCMGLFSACAEEETKSKVVTEKEQKAVEKNVTEPEKEEEEIKEEEIKEEEIREKEKIEEEEKIEENELPFDGTMNFLFATGVGGWYTELSINPDGAFTGEYIDGNMGESGDGYLGTTYFSHFEGSIEKIEKIDQYSYKLYLGDITLTDEQKEPWIEDDTLMVPSDAHGLWDCKELYLYVPGTDVTQFPEDFMSWWVMRYADDGSLKTTLDCYALHNPEGETAFFAYE